jgi:nucleoside-diphosphate-sugar epimerase
MRLAILGASSQIAGDLLRSFSAQSQYELTLFARRPHALRQWLDSTGLSGRHTVAPYDEFHPGQAFDAVLNFVGVGNPARAALLGAEIFEVTRHYDELALRYVRQHPACRYVFLSSGAAYGSNFAHPVDQDSLAQVAINHLQPQDWYAVAKLYAECRHRALPELAIIDIRVFNYFSRTQDLDARFLISDMVRAIRDQTLLLTSSDYIVRDFIHPEDFSQLVQRLLSAAPQNLALDCYSRAPIDKPALLAAMQDHFALRYQVVERRDAVNATGLKPYYYSQNTRAAAFGYQPQFSSLQGLLQETSAILQQSVAKGVL